MRSGKRQVGQQSYTDTAVGNGVGERKENSGVENRKTVGDVRKASI
jgi:hypothetical protein